MKYSILALKLAIFVYLIYLLVFLSIEYNPASPKYRPPFVIWIIDIINLYIHEAGHFFFKVFGQWMYFLGGSIFQCLIPLALIVVCSRQNITNASYAGFWLGENMINVSIYIKDAPYQKLRLISSGLIHDWHWLLSDNLDIAETLSNFVFISGVLIGLISIVVGIIFSIRDFKWYRAQED